MSERIVRKKYVTEIKNRYGVFYESTETIDRNIKGLDDMKKTRNPESALIKSFPLEVHIPQVYSKDRGQPTVLNLDKHENERRKADEMRDVAPLEKLKQIIRQAEESSTKKDRIFPTFSPNIPPHVSLNPPSITKRLANISNYSLLEKITNLEKKLEDVSLSVEEIGKQMIELDEKLRNDFNEAFGDHKNITDNCQEIARKQVGTLLDQIIDFNMQLTGLNSSVEKLRSIKEPKEKAVLVNDVSLITSDEEIEEGTAIMSPPVTVRLGRRPSQAFIRFSPETRSGFSNLVDSDEFNSKEEQISKDEQDEESHI